MTLYLIQYDTVKSHGEVEVKHKNASIFSQSTIQGDLCEKVSIVGGNNISHCEKEWICVLLWVVADTELYESGVPCYSIPLLWCIRFLFVGLDGERSLRSVGTWDELHANIFYMAAHIKKGDDQLRWTTCDLRTLIAKCIEVGRIFEHFCCEL